MKKVLHDSSYGIVLLHSHGIVLALSEYNTSTQKREITYAHQTRIMHSQESTSADILLKVYETYRFGLEKFLNEVQKTPDKFFMYLGDSLGHAVFRKHSIKRKIPFQVTEKLIFDMEQKDIQKILKSYEGSYHQPHRVTHTNMYGSIVNGYIHNENYKTLPPQVFSLEHIFAHTVVPEKVINNLDSIIKDVFHRDISLEYRNISSTVISYLTQRVNGPCLFVHIGETSTGVFYINDHMVHTQIHIPIGTSNLVNQVMQEQKITFSESVQIFKMVYDDRVTSPIVDNIRKTINQFWSHWQREMTSQLEKLVIKGVTIPKIIYSYDSEVIHIDEHVFPGSPYELWYGARSVQHVPCEAIIGQGNNLVAHTYIKSLLLFIQNNILNK